MDFSAFSLHLRVSASKWLDLQTVSIGPYAGLAVSGPGHIGRIACLRYNDPLCFLIEHASLSEQAVAVTVSSPFAEKSMCPVAALPVGMAGAAAT